jgi:leucine-rich repeat transmembrane neuronal protein 1/2
MLNFPFHLVVVQVEGNIFAVFNVGTHDLPLGEIGVKVNDNNYHVVRFTRSGGNATLQIDDYNVQTLHAQGWYNFYCCRGEEK